LILLAEVHDSITRSNKCPFSAHLIPHHLFTMPIRGLAPSTTPITPAHFDIERVIRPNILALHPYRCARDDYQEGILLDANENALGHSIPRSSNQIHQELSSTLDADLNRYPDPSHDQIKYRIASLRSLPGKDHIFLGVGSDEVIDLLMRVCVAPVNEKILITPPTYGMYSVCAQVNDIGVVRCNLNLSGSGGEGGEYGRFSLLVDDVSVIFYIMICQEANGV
jgi:histidinol-phosphate aminotransferase